MPKKVSKGKKGSKAKDAMSTEAADLYPWGVNVNDIIQVRGAVRPALTTQLVLWTAAQRLCVRARCSFADAAGGAGRRPRRVQGRFVARVAGQN